MSLVDDFCTKTAKNMFWGPVSASMLYQTSGKFTKEYFSPYYQTEKSLDYDALCFMNQTERYGFLTQDSDHEIAKIVWKNYLHDTASLDVLLTKFLEHEKKILQLYYTLTPAYIQTLSTEECRQFLLHVRHHLWHMNGAIAFASIFSKELCLEIVEKEKGKSFADEVELIRDIASAMDDITFHKKIFFDYLQGIATGQSQEQQALRMQYANSSYHHTYDHHEVFGHIKKEYGVYSISEAHKELTSFLLKEETKASVHWSTFQHTSYTYFQTIMQYRDQKKYLTMHGITLLYRIARELADRTHTERSYVDYCTFDEISQGISFFEKNRGEIQQRIHGCVGYQDYQGKTTIELCNFAQTNDIIRNHYQKSNQLSMNQTTIKGTIGCKGYIKGKVKIVKEIDTVESFPEGAILVAVNTRPEMMKFLTKAQGIITDEGGITCHAAVVSRELQIPCVIGTRIASHVLRDGDSVELDANTGIITKI